MVYNNSSTAWSSPFISETDMRVQLLRRSWDDFFADHMGEGELRLQFCAGDSVFIVRNALRDYPHRMRIIVIAIAPSCLIPTNLCYLIRYYRSWRDISSIQCGPNSLPLVTEILVGDPESRGVLDVWFHSSTFLDFIRMEAMCFGLRQELLRAQRLPADYDAAWQGLRDRYMRDSDEGPVHSRSYAEISLRHRQLLADFLSEFAAEFFVSSLNNLYEIAQDEYPVNHFESFLFVLNTTRSGLVILEQTMVGVISGRVLPLAAIGIPILEMLSLLVRSGSSLVRRGSQGERSLIREISLRGGLMHLVCWIYEVGVFPSILSGMRTPQYVTWGLGTHIVFTGATLTAENLIYLCPSLRGRLDACLTRIITSTMRMERNANEEANRVGLIQRIIRSTAQLGRGVGTIAVAGVMLYSMFAPTENDSADNHNNDLSLDRHIGHVTALGLVGLISAASIVGNVRQIRNIFRMLRRMDSGASDSEEVSEVVERRGE